MHTQSLSTGLALGVSSQKVSLPFLPSCFPYRSALVARISLSKRGTLRLLHIRSLRISEVLCFYPGRSLCMPPTRFEHVLPSGCSVEVSVVFKRLLGQHLFRQVIRRRQRRVLTGLCGLLASLYCLLSRLLT
ncbi:Uncharacterised protein [Mycobacteroides abscessus subsp. abscessus]|nr:Uncharacterised protein [Mycobacteroides abscessus subsp. abscessus]